MTPAALRIVWPGGAVVALTRRGSGPGSLSGSGCIVCGTGRAVHLSDPFRQGEPLFSSNDQL